MTKEYKISEKNLNLDLLESIMEYITKLEYMNEKDAIFKSFDKFKTIKGTQSCLALAFKIVE